jgi:DNA-binding response OmpR family regulator
MAKLLVVEDDEQLLETLRLWLQMQKHKVTAVTNGTDAEEQLKFSTFDAIVLDWHLPGKDGIDVLKEYRSSGGQTPVLMLSGNDARSEVQEGLASGASDYLKKPFKFQELAERLNSLLEP